MNPAVEHLNQAALRRVPSRLSLRAASRFDAGEATNLGAEEEFHVVDRNSRELVAQGPQLLRRLPAGAYSAELHRSVVESNTPVCTGLSDLRRAWCAPAGSWLR